MVKKVFAALLLVFVCSSVVLSSAPRDCKPQVFEVDDPLEASLSGMILWGKLEDPNQYLQAAESSCLSVILTRAPSGDWLWIPSWDSVEEKQATLAVFQEAGLEVPWPLSGPHSLSYTNRGSVP